MPKLKSNSSAKKRFRFTGTGKAKISPSRKRHNLRKRPQKMKRQARGMAVAAAPDHRRDRDLAPHQHAPVVPRPGSRIDVALPVLGAVDRLGPGVAEEHLGRVEERAQGTQALGELDVAAAGAPRRAREAGRAGSPPGEGPDAGARQGRLPPSRGRLLRRARGGGRVAARRASPLGPAPPARCTAPRPG